MNISHIEHIGIAVNSLEDAIPYYENVLNLKCYAIEEVADQKVRTAFFQVGQTKIELLEEKGVTLIDKTSRKGAEGLNIGFLHPKATQGVLTELCSKES